MSRVSRAGFLSKLSCGVCKQQEERGGEDADSNVDALQLQNKADQFPWRTNLYKAILGEDFKAQAQERQPSIKDLLCIQYCVQCKKKGRGDSEASNEKAVEQHVEAGRRKISEEGPIRVLVLGRSGAGKTTLIRLLVGNEGPESISEGVAGVQDINKEFVYLFEEEHITFIIHDSNGMDVKGKERVNEILAFLDKHQQCDDFRECIHIIWYVISAIDTRFVDDGDVMKLLTKYKIPLLLIMTHKDYDKVKVTEASLNRLLQAYGDNEEREAVKRLMVKVSNEGVCVGSNNELVIDDTKQDTEGLRLVALRTKILVDRMRMQSTSVLQSIP